MKRITMKKTLPSLSTAIAVVALYFGVATFTTLAVMQAGCKGLGGGVTLAPGGVYTDPVLAVTDRSILDANKALRDFVAWQNENAVALAKWPQIAEVAGRIALQEPDWSKDAHEARDAYRTAAIAYRDAIARGEANAVPPSRAKIDAALAVLTSAVTEVLAYRSAHAHP